MVTKPLIYLYTIILLFCFEGLNATTISKDTNMNINVIISFDVKKDKLNEFSELLENVKKELPTVEGCNGVKIYSDANSPLSFTLVENWTSKKLHEKHISSLIESGAWDTISGYLNTPPKSSYYSEI